MERNERPDQNEELTRDEIDFASIETAMEEIRRGRMLIVVDDEDRENEGDLVMAAEKVTPEAINFMARFGRGLICMPLNEERLDELEIPMMVRQDADDMSTAFAVSVDARSVSTGISARERAHTVRILVDPKTKPEDLEMPGHIFPLRAKPGGVLRRPGHTEAAVDLARMAGFSPAGVICEVMNEDGSMARVADLAKFARKHDLKMITIADLIRYRMQRERLVERIARVEFPTRLGKFVLHAYEEQLAGKCHIALVKGVVDDGRPVLVRPHSECLTGDVFHALRCDCGAQLEAALEAVEAEGRGVVLYMRQEGRGIGLANKLRAYQLQEEGLDTVEANEALGLPADARDYGTGAQILVDLGVSEIRLLTNNPGKQYSLAGYGLKIVERVPLDVGANAHNRQYLATKKTKLGHLFGSTDQAAAEARREGR